MIYGVIFDMDGLMTDTERLFLRLWCDIMREKGYPEHRELVTHCIGLNHGAIRSYLDETLGRDFDYMGILMEVGRRSEAYIASHGVPVKPGLYELLDYLDKHHIYYGVATSTHKDRAKMRLQNIGVLDRLDALVTGDMVSVGKPEPEIFELTSEALKLQPEYCLVLEDSPHGIIAAHRAFCKPVMIPDLKEPTPETEKLLYAKCNSLVNVIDLLGHENRI